MASAVNDSVTVGLDGTCSGTWDLWWDLMGLVVGLGTCGGT